MAIKLDIECLYCRNPNSSIYIITDMMPLVIHANLGPHDPISGDIPPIKDYKEGWERLGVQAVESVGGSWRAYDVILLVILSCSCRKAETHNTSN